MPATKTIDNSADVIYSRDVIERIEYLEDPYERDEEEDAEYKALVALQDEAEGYSEDWRHGAALIRDSYFTEYAQDLAEDIGAIGKDLAWPACHIDWDAAADALKQDYTSVDFDGVTYWVR